MFRKVKKNWIPFIEGLRAKTEQRIRLEQKRLKELLKSDLVSLMEEAAEDGKYFVRLSGSGCHDNFLTDAQEQEVREGLAEELREKRYKVETSGYFQAKSKGYDDAFLDVSWYPEENTNE